ncbi:hypothetical protein K503DRAFT_468217 [Rhizopogon vinicolor AM-OR11-026]|uniref:Uncharacterized protein n=1 Tax=Rhizopogon vinicolor AM-OR11-026 TaxID=1314800 RepID=A0A1B7MNF9_9AGAM|nr:hypothetical protein K503DRAFT_468217 [Rhizopogon vinicolor AM-OR11-026]
MRSFLAKEARITSQCCHVYLLCAIASIGWCVCERFEPACIPWSGKQILPGSHVRRPPKGHVYRGGYRKKRYVHIKRIRTLTTAPYLINKWFSLVANGYAADYVVPLETSCLSHLSWQLPRILIYTTPPNRARLCRTS